MSLHKLWSILLFALILSICLASCTSQNTESVITSSTSTPLQTITQSPSVQTAVWENLIFSVVETEWKGNVVKLRIKIENKGNQTATFNSVFYAYGENGSQVRMCQSTLNLWGTYGIDDTRSEAIHFILPTPSSDIWLAIEATKIIRVPHSTVPQPLGARREYTFQTATWSFTLKKVEWASNRVGITIAIQNTGNTEQNFKFTEWDGGSPIFRLGVIQPIGNMFQWKTDWYIGTYAIGDIRSGVIYFDVPSCMVGFNLIFRQYNLFEIYR